jgi:hypothetical protein
MRNITTIAAAAALLLAPVVGMAQTPDAQTGPATAIPDQTIGKAGAALHDVAKLQQKYQSQMESAPAEQKKGISEQANAEAVEATQPHGISLKEYSNVMRTAQNNPKIKERVLEAARQGE